MAEEAIAAWNTRTQQLRPDASAKRLAEELAGLPTAEAYVSREYLLLTREQRARILAAVTTRGAVLEECAAYLDGYAGGHYMAQSCAAAIRALDNPRCAPHPDR